MRAWLGLDKLRDSCGGWSRSNSTAAPGRFKFRWVLGLFLVVCIENIKYQKNMYKRESAAGHLER